MIDTCFSLAIVQKESKYIKKRSFLSEIRCSFSTSKLVTVARIGQHNHTVTQEEEKKQKKKTVRSIYNSSIVNHKTSLLSIVKETCVPPLQVLEGQGESFGAPDVEGARIYFAP